MALFLERMCAQEKLRECCNGHIHPQGPPGSLRHFTFRRSQAPSLKQLWIAAPWGASCRPSLSCRLGLTSLHTLILGHQCEQLCSRCPFIARECCHYSWHSWRVPLHSFPQHWSSRRTAVLFLTLNGLKDRQ